MKFWTASAIVVMLTANAQADLIQNTVQTDTSLTHLSWVIDTQLSPAQTGYSSPNWEWSAAQKLATDGRTWVIDIHAHHVVAPHANEEATGGPLLVIIPNLFPGGAGHGTSRAAHAGRGHFDTLIVGYLPISSSSSRLTIQLEHKVGDRAVGGPWPGIPWKPGIVIVVVVATLAGGVWLFRRNRRRS